MKLTGIGSKKVLIILVIIAIVAAFLELSFILLIIDEDVEYDSLLSSVNIVISQELRGYYKKNGRYPENLQVLREWSPNSDYFRDNKGRDLLNEFKYSTDSNSYVMTREIWNYMFREKGENGEMAQSEVYLNGKPLENDRE